MNADRRVRDLIAQQRVVTSSHQPKLEGEPRLGDVVAFALSVVVLAFTAIDTVIGVLL